MIQRSFDCGIKKFVFPSISSKYNEKMLSRLKKYPDNIFLMAGLHPVYVKDDYENELNRSKIISTMIKYLPFAKYFFYLIGFKMPYVRLFEFVKA